MIRNFFSTPNVLGRLMVILLFAGGLVFAGAYDGFVVETEASGCCGGGVDDAIFSSSSCCAPTKSCKSGCNQSAAGECGPGNGSLCPTKGDEYDPEEDEGYCCDVDSDGNCS